MPKSHGYWSGPARRGRWGFAALVLFALAGLFLWLGSKNLLCGFIGILLGVCGGVALSVATTDTTGD